MRVCDAAVGVGLCGRWDVVGFSQQNSAPSLTLRCGKDWETASLQESCKCEYSTYGRQMYMYR
jgi:hypothetical protein